MQIRPATGADWPDLFTIFVEVVVAEDTYTYPADTTEAQARALWIEDPPGRTTVADVDGQVLGTAKMGPNRAGRGAHVATASYMVAATARGTGVGTALCRDSLAWARAQGFAGMQFNAVVETNRGAVAIYEREGFRIVGTVPGAFDHPTEGRVGLHVMYCGF